MHKKQSKFITLIYKQPLTSIFLLFPSALLVIALLINLFVLSKDQQSANYSQIFLSVITIVAFVLSGCLSLMISVRNAQIDEESKKKKNTFDLLYEKSTNEFLVKQREDFSELLEFGELIQWANAWTLSLETHQKDKFKKAKHIINNHLVQYANIGTGVQNETLSEDMINDHIGEEIIIEWKALLPLIRKIRLDTENPDLYIKVQQLVERLTYLNEKNKKH